MAGAECWPRALANTLSSSSEDGWCWKPLHPAEKCHWPPSAVCCGAKIGGEPARSPHHLLLPQELKKVQTVVGLSNSPSREFLPVVPPWRERRGEDRRGQDIRTDLCCVCQWSHPRSRAQRCGTWPPSGLSAWPCCCGWHRAELLLHRASPFPPPGSPPVTECHSSPSLAEQAAYERHSCQSQHERERGKEKVGGQNQRLSFHCAGGTCCNTYPGNYSN